MGNLDGVLSSVFLTVMFFSPPLLFIVFLILTLVQIPKVKRKETGKSKLVTFAVLASVFLFFTVVEIVFICILAAAVAHM
jgi:hypothetical protein